MLLDIDPFDNPLKVDKFGQKFLQHLKLESERYVTQSGKNFKVSMHELNAFICALWLDTTHFPTCKVVGKQDVYLFVGILLLMSW